MTEPKHRDYCPKCGVAYEPLLELAELDTAVNEQVLPELVAAVHLEHEAAEIAEPLLPCEQ